MRMLVRMTVFKTSDYLFLFRELATKEDEGSEQEQGPHHEQSELHQPSP